MVGDMLCVTLNFDLSKIPFVHFYPGSRPILTPKIEHVHLLVLIWERLQTTTTTKRGHHSTTIRVTYRQFIPPGEQRHMRVNNLSSVAMWPSIKRATYRSLLQYPMYLLSHHDTHHRDQNATDLQYHVKNTRLTKDCVISSSVGCFSPRFAPDFVMQSSRFWHCTANRISVVCKKHDQRHTHACTHTHTHATVLRPSRTSSA